MKGTIKDCCNRITFFCGSVYVGWREEKPHILLNSELFMTCDSSRFLWLAQRETSSSLWRVCVTGWRTTASTQILQQTGSPTLG